MRYLVPSTGTHLDLVDDGILPVCQVVLLGLECLKGLAVIELEIVHRDALTDANNGATTERVMDAKKASGNSISDALTNANNNAKMEEYKTYIKPLPNPPVAQTPSSRHVSSKIGHLPKNTEQGGRASTACIVRYQKLACLPCACVRRAWSCWSPSVRGSTRSRRSCSCAAW